MKILVKFYSLCGKSREKSLADEKSNTQHFVCKETESHDKKNLTTKKNGFIYEVPFLIDDIISLFFVLPKKWSLLVSNFSRIAKRVCNPNIFHWSSDDATFLGECAILHIYGQDDKMKSPYLSSWVNHFKRVTICFVKLTVLLS